MKAMRTLLPLLLFAAVAADLRGADDADVYSRYRNPNAEWTVHGDLGVALPVIGIAVALLVGVLMTNRGQPARPARTTRRRRRPVAVQASWSYYD
jgi:hypothetical protein